MIHFLDHYKLPFVWLHSQLEATHTEGLTACAVHVLPKLHD